MKGKPKRHETGRAELNKLQNQRQRQEKRMKCINVTLKNIKNDKRLKTFSRNSFLAYNKLSSCKTKLQIY